MLDYLPILFHAITITSFVFVMMVVIEYVNVLSRGAWLGRVSTSRWRQYGLAVILGGTPGCLGAFVVVAACAHGSLSLGAVVAAMIATSGDEAFVMFALIPRDAFILTALLLVVGLIAGRATDLFAGRRATPTGRCCQELRVHGEECNCFPTGDILSQWRRCSLSRALLAVALSFVLLATMLGLVGPTLDDIDWRNDRLRIPERKAGHSTAYPLSTVVGEAILDYLKNGRPETQERRIFFRSVAPRVPIGEAAIAARASHYLRKAGIDVPRGGSHTLRHTCVQRLVDA